MVRKDWIVIILLLLALVISGCAKKQENAVPETTHEITEGVTESPVGQTTPESEESVSKEMPSKTCVELNGDICEVGEECTGEWLDASDTFNCCSEKCEYEGGKEIITIVPFELNEEDEELGELV